MKTIKNILYIILIVISFSGNCFSQEWDEQGVGPVGAIDFINLNYGWTAVSGSQGFNVLKTINKGMNWSSIYEYNTFSNSEVISIDMVNSNLGFIYYGGKVLKTYNGGQNWQTVFDLNPDNDPNMNSIRPLIKFYNIDTGYISYTRFDKLDGVKIFRTTNSGTTWDVKMHYPQGGNRNFVYTDLTFENNNPLIVTFCGYGGYTNLAELRFFGARSTNGGESFDAFGGPIAANKYQLKYVNYLPGLSQTCRMIMVEYRSNSDRGTYCYEFINGNLGNKYKINSNSDFNLVGGLRFIDQNNGYVIIDRELYKTTNSGVNWNVFYTTQGNTATGGNSHILEAFGDQIYLGAYNGSFYTKKLTTNIQSFFDNQSVSSSILFDGNSISTPFSDYLRGGFTSLSCSNFINYGQSNEKIFYKWSDGFMNASHNVGDSYGHDFYFDMSGTTIANYYKTKQLSTVSGAIANLSQTKSIRDTTINGVTATHTIHESIGGIFYAKSTNFGTTYQPEEPVNHSIEGASEGNKNASLCIITKGGNSGAITSLDPERNVAVVWERYNSLNKVEIRLARRERKSDNTGYEWNDSNKIITSFDAPSVFQSFPKCFVAGSPMDSSGFYFHAVVVPYLKYSTGGTKLMVAVRNLNHSQDYELDNGEISDLSVVNLRNSYRTFEIHFAYKKGNNIVYRNETVGVDPYVGIYHHLNDSNNNISSGDGGFPSRFTPDISLMNNIPVITYAASYDAWRTIQYEDQTSGSIQVYRYPIVKVQKTPTGWSQFVIYNSGNNQSKPDIEGSTSNLSYILNYSIGNGSFKKIVNIPGYAGLMCQPNIFSGTDSRLINNSYTGSFGSNLSLLTLSPQSGLYKLDKQNFVITNITAQDSYDIDNLDGVVDLDTVSYSFKVGPIYTQSFFEYYYEVDGVGVIGPSLEDQVIGGIEFNENLKSYPFLLNESQALLIGSNASYVKDNSHYSISEIPYTVKLYNKTTGLLHRILFQDTIRDQDSVETESLRGFYITDIPNGADSFYVKLEVDDEFENADYFINPIYEDENEEQDNMSERKLAVIFENTNPQIHDNNIPVKYDLLQNYPNPFNPTTNLEFGISELGFVSLKVYDILGKEVKTLVNEIKPAGTYSVLFDGSNLASGVYFYRIEAGEFREIKRMILLK